MMRDIGRNAGLVLMAGGAVALGFGLGGCVGYNQRTTLGDDVQLSSLSDGAAGGESKYAGMTGTLSDERGTLEQRNWEEQEFLVPLDRVGHRAVMWRREIVMPTKTARQRGEYPTPVTALDLSGPSGEKTTHSTQAAETLLATPMGVVGDTVLLVPRMVSPGPAGRKGSPRWGYERAPEAGAAWRGNIAGDEVMPEGVVPVAPVAPVAAPVVVPAVPVAVPAAAPAGGEQLPILPAAAKGGGSGGGGGAEKPK